MKLNKILSTISCAALMLSAWSCTEEIKYEPTAPSEGSAAYFNTENSNLSFALNEGQSSVLVPINRLGAGQELTVDLASTASDAAGNEVNNIFSLPTSVTFPADATLAEINVGIDFALIEPNVEYILTFTIDGKFTSPYGNSETTVKLSYAPWTKWEQYSTTPFEGEMGSPFTGEPISGIVMYRKSILDENVEMYGFPGPYYSNFYFDYLITIDKSKEVMIDGEKCYLATMPITDTHYMIAEDDGNEYPILYADAQTFIKEFLAPLNGLTPDEISDDFIHWAYNQFGLSDSYFNPELGRFYMNLVPWDEAGSLWKRSTTILQLPGFADYSLEFSLVGNMVNAEGEESVILHSYMSDDLASYAYTIKEGALSSDEIAAEVDAIKADGSAARYDEKSRNFLFTFAQDAQGDYTLVAVGYNASGDAVVETSYTFEAVTVQANNPWKTIGEAEYTDCFIYDLYADPDAPADENLGGETWSVEVQENSETPGLFRLVNPYKNWPELVGYPYATYNAGNYYLTIDATDPEHVKIPMANLGLVLDSEDGQLMCTSFAWMYEQQGKTTEEIEELEVYGIYEDEVILFPENALLATVEIAYPNFYYANTYGFFQVDLAATEPLSAPAKKNIKKAPKLKTPGKTTEVNLRDETVSLLNARRAAIENKTRIF